MDNEVFLNALREEVDTFNQAVATSDGDWVVKGFIDIAKNVYTISVDTKVVSKIMELLLFPSLMHFAEKNTLKVILATYQNHYPDMSFIDDKGNRFALDLKSTYRRNRTTVNGMTLGTFTGYFRDRKGQKNITFPYDSYSGHFVLGIIYSQTDVEIDERKRYKLAELESIPSVVCDFQFFVHEKYRIAQDRPGSGNTRNIGSVTKISQLINGTGPFAELGIEVFDDYWMYYLTNDMARAAELPKPPYTNLNTYFEYKGLKR